MQLSVILVLFALIGVALCNTNAYKILDRHNTYRRSKGRSTLKCEPSIMAEAQRRAQMTASRDPRKSIHIYSGSALWTNMPTAGRRAAGENAYGYPRLDLDGIMAGWIKSAPHHANMLSTNFNHIGVGVAKGASGWYYWVVIFGGYSGTRPACRRPSSSTCSTSVVSTLWGVNKSRSVYRWHKGWKRSCGRLKQITLSRTYVWGLSATNQIYKCKLPCAGKWVRVAGILSQIDATSNLIIGVNGAGNIYHKPINGSGSRWSRLAGPKLKHITTTPTYMWGVTPTNRLYFRRRGRGWVKVPGILKQVDAGLTEVCGVNTAGSVYCKPVNNSRRTWRRIGTVKLNHVTVGRSYMTGVTTAGAIHQCRLPCSGRWTRVGGTLTNIERAHV